VKWLSEHKKRHQDCLMSSTQSFYSPRLWLVVHSTHLWFPGMYHVPSPHVQVCHCMWLNFTRPSPALVLQATNGGVRRPGYKATH